jgi:hypothetical protein
MLNSNPAAQIGIRGLYQGVKPCYLRDISFAAIYFGIYHEGRSFACLSLSFSLSRARACSLSLSLSLRLSLSLSLSLALSLSQACAGPGRK